MEPENNNNSSLTARPPKLNLNEVEMWRIMIEQYFLVLDYALWEIIMLGDSYKPGTTSETVEGVTVQKQNTSPVTSEEKLQRKNDLKARSLLLMSLPKDQIIAFSKYTSAKQLFDEVCSVFGGNDATKKTQKTLLK